MGVQATLLLYWWNASRDGFAISTEITVDEGAQGDLRGTLAAKGTW